MNAFLFLKRNHITVIWLHETETFRVSKQKLSRAEVEPRKHDVFLRKPNIMFSVIFLPYLSVLARCQSFCSSRNLIMKMAMRSGKPAI